MLSAGLTRAGSITALVLSILVASLGVLAVGTVAAPQAGASTIAPPPFEPPTATALQEINFDRAMAGLPPVTENSSWDQGDQLHSVYSVETGTLAHYEDPTSPYYTAAGNQAAGQSDVADWSSGGALPPTAKSWVDQLMLAPFHGMEIIAPGLTSTGFGDFDNGNGGPATAAAVGINTLSGWNGTIASSPVMWPGNGVTTPFTTFPGNETPDPLTSCPGYSAPTGAPIFLLLPQTPAVSAYSVTSNGTSVPTCEIDETNYVNPNPTDEDTGRGVLNQNHGILLIPESPLTPGQSYTVDVDTGTSAGEVTWTFNVAASNQASVALSSSEPFASPGDAVTLSASVTQAYGTTTPTGTLTFYDGSTSLGSATLDATGSASLTTSSLSTGAHSITAQYSGDANYGAQTSPALAETIRVSIAGSTTTVSAAANPVYANQSAKFSASVSVPSGDPTPTGNVEFSNGSTQLGTATLGSDATATLSVPSLPQGSDTITATYIGDINYSGSTSSVLETVQAPQATDITLEPFSPNVAIGNPDTMEAVVTGPNGTPAPPGALVDIDDVSDSGGQTAAVSMVTTVALGSGGYVEVPVNLGAGCHVLEAVYSGAPGLAASTSATVTICVGTAPGLPANGSAAWGTGNAGTSGPVFCFAGDPVNCYNGNLAESATDLEVAGRTPGFAWSRTYNSLAATSATATSPMGWGWSDAFSSSLSFPASGQVVVNQADGSEVPFAAIGSGYLAPPSVNATLAQNADGTYTYSLADQDTSTFSSTGQLTSMADRNGDTLSLAYADGELSTITDGAGRAITLTYNAAGQIASATDPAGNVVSYGYDATGDLTSVTEPNGAKTTYAYDASHRLVSMTDAIGGTTTNTYDPSNRIISQSDPMGRTTTWSYGTSSSGGATTTITDPLGHVRSETFGSDGQLLTLTKGVGTPSPATWTYTYNAQDEQTQIVDPDGNTTMKNYDSDGNLTAVFEPVPAASLYVYDAHHDLLKKTDALDNVTTYTYSPDGDLATVTQPPPAAGQQPVVTTYAHADSAHPGDITSMTDPDGHTTSYAYDAYGDLVKTTDPLGDVTTATYNVLGQKIGSTTPDGNAAGANPSAFTSTYSYDWLGRLRTSTDALGNTTTSTYDAAGNLVSLKSPGGGVTRYTYDADNEATGSTAPNGATTSATYDADGNVTAQKNADGQSTTYRYNAFGEKASSTDALGDTTSYTYDPDGLLLTSTSPTGVTTTYTYDADSRMTSKTYSDGTHPVQDLYNADGQLDWQSDGTGGNTLYYDNLGRLTQYQNTVGNGSVTYSYDPAGNLLTLSSESGTASYAYNAANQMASVSDGSGNTTNFAYDPSGNLTTIVHPDGSSDTYRFNADSMIAEVKAITANATLYDLSTPRNALSDVTSQSAAIPGSQTVTTGYSYDTNEELTGTTLGTGPLAEPLSNFTYNPAGNITAENLAGQGVQSNTYNADSELASSSDPTTGTSTAYVYDAAGERTSETTTVAGEPLTTTFGWNGAGELTSESGPTTTGSFSYNGFGLLASGPVDPLSYNLDAAVPEIISDGIHGFVRGPGGLVVEETTLGEEPIYYHHDQLGSVKSLTGPNGHQLVRYIYSAYGASTASATGIANPFGFADSYTDPLSHLVYLTNRWYDPSTAQFLSVDPAVAQTGTPYSYAGDDPINNVDPTGLAWCSFLPAGCGTVSNFDAGAVSGVESVAPALHSVANTATQLAGACAVFTADPLCAAVAAGAGTIAAGTGLVMYADGQQSGTATTADLVSLGFSAFGGAAEVAGDAASSSAEAADNLSYAYAPGSAGEAYQENLADGYNQMAGSDELMGRGFSLASLGSSIYGQSCS